jgi:broad-specificity NMP kinase
LTDKPRIKRRLRKKWWRRRGVEEAVSAGETVGCCLFEAVAAASVLALLAVPIGLRLL